MEKDKNRKNYTLGRAFAMSGISMTTIALITYFLGGAPFYYALLFLLGIVLGFIGAFFILLSFRKNNP
ncbi:MAG: hypothetical protein AAGC45_08330 [Bacteroidota bacterium]